jgi:hypothetical protein
MDELRMIEKPLSPRLKTGMSVCELRMKNAHIDFAARKIPDAVFKVKIHAVLEPWGHETSVNDHLIHVLKWRTGQNGPLTQHATI